MGRRQIGCVVSSALMLAAIFGPHPIEAQRIGLFLDQGASVCHGSIEPFGADVHVYMIAFPPANVAINGALLRIDLPAGLDLAVSDPFTTTAMSSWKPAVNWRPGDAPVQVCQTVSTPLC